TAICRSTVSPSNRSRATSCPRPQFYSLLRRRGPQRFAAFDLLWLDGRDLRMLPLLERKRHLRALIHADACLRYVDHIERAGTDFYRVAWSTRLGRHCRQAEGWLVYAGLNQLSEDQES